MMKYTILASLLISAISLGGCGATESGSTESNAGSAKLVSNKSKSLGLFLSLHEKYCEPGYKSPEELQTALSSAPQFSQTKDYDGIYETVVDSVSYAISPEGEGCTTDVMIKTATSERPYFSFEDLNASLIAKGYKEHGTEIIHTEVGINNAELKVMEKHYLSPNNVLTILDFPLEKQDQYYMTLFAEKFNDKKEERSSTDADMKMANII
jgi:hypothetical protein